jgi:DHA2 family multidrug resistance protein
MTATAAAPVAGMPPLSTAIRTVAIFALALAGSSISSQLVDLGIADLGGGFSISADEVSWIACTATMAEVAAIPIAATLARALSLRRVVLYAALVFALSAFASLHAGTVDALLVLRAIQSFCSGIMSVLMFVAVMASLPPGAARSVALAFFAFTSSAPNALNATVGAFVTDRFDWQGLYYFDIAWALAFLLVAWRGLRPAPSALGLSEIDWIGYLLTAAGLAALILFMKQGDRFFWLENPIIVRAGLFATVLCALATWAMLARARPLMDLSLMAKPTFGWAIALATFYRFGLVMSAFVVPQALTRLQGFRMPEIAAANTWMFWGQCISFPLAWLWASRADARVPLSLGLLLFAAGAALGTRLTPEWQAGDFALTLFVIGLGQGLFLVPTVFYATRDVAPQHGTTAASLFNLSRVVGQTFGIAVIGSLITEREKFHSALLVDNLSAAGAAFTERFNSLVASFVRLRGDDAVAQLQAWQSLSGAASNQAYVLAFADSFVIVALVLAASAFLVLMLPPLRASARTDRPNPNTAAGNAGRPT